MKWLLKAIWRRDYGAVCEEVCTILLAGTEAHTPEWEKRLRLADWICYHIFRWV